MVEAKAQAWFTDESAWAVAHSWIALKDGDEPERLTWTILFSTPGGQINGAVMESWLHRVKELVTGRGRIQTKLSMSAIRALRKKWVIFSYCIPK